MEETLHHQKYKSQKYYQDIWLVHKKIYIMAQMSNYSVGLS